MLDNGETSDWGHRSTWVVWLGWIWAEPLITHCSAHAPHTWGHCQFLSTGTAADPAFPSVPTFNISELHIPVLTSAIHHRIPALGGNVMRKGYDEACFPTVIKTGLTHEVRLHTLVSSTPHLFSKHSEDGISLLLLLAQNVWEQRR